MVDPSKSSETQPVALLNTTEIRPYLSRLEALLKGLPESITLGQQFYNFTYFGVSEEDKEDYGEDGALNYALEILFCPAGRQKVPIVYRERGTGLVAVVNVLRTAIDKSPNSVILQK